MWLAGTQNISEQLLGNLACPEKEEFHESCFIQQEVLLNNAERGLFSSLLLISGVSVAPGFHFLWGMGYKQCWAGIQLGFKNIWNVLGQAWSNLG